MANYADLIAAIANAIKYNDNHEITGEILQEQLLAIINAIGEAGYIFAGVATQETNPGSPDSNVVYLAGRGTYANFGATDVEKGHIGVFAYNGSWDYEVIETGAYFEYEEYPQGAAIEFTFYDSDNPDGVSVKINKDVSGISNAPDEAISQWWAAQMKWKLQDVQGYTDTFPSLSTSVQSLGLFGVIKTGKVIDSITGTNKLIFIAEDTTEYVVTSSDLPYKALADLVSVKLESGTASNVSIHVRGEMDMLISHINKPINEILSSFERIKDEENLDCIDIVTNTGTLILRIKDNEILAYNKLLVQDVDIVQQLETIFAKINKKLGTKAAFDIFQKKIKGLSEQPDNTQESCIELQDNGGNKYGNVSIDSQYNAEDDAVEFRRSDNDELVAKIDKEGVKAKSFLLLNPQSKSLVIVDKNGNGDYTTISAALAGTSNWDTILVMPGIYEEHVEMYNKPRHLIGVSKESVQVITHDGLRANNPCNANVGSIENMTFIARIDQIPEGYWDLPAINRSTYGIHIDARYQEGGQISTNRHTLIVKNVDCISEVSAGIGIGIRYNQTIKLIDCNFYAISGDVNHPNVQGGYYMHNDDFYPNESGADMYLINCICKGEIKGGRIDSLNNNSLCNVTLINNTFYSSQNGVTDAMNVPTNHKWYTDISQTVICHGNNISELNY